MRSQSIVRLVSTVLASGCVFLPQYAHAADAPDMTAAPPTAEDARPAAPPPQADTPKPISEAPPAGPATERSAKNAVYVEGLGAGGLYSINYERVFGDFSPRVGFSYVSVSSSATTSAGTSSASASLMTFPITVSYLGIGSMNHMFELGAGATIVAASAGAGGFNRDSGSASAVGVWPNVLFGYRYQPADGGFFFKGGIDALIGGSIFPVLPWPYISLGGTF